MSIFFVRASMKYNGLRRDSSRLRQRYSPIMPSITIWIPPKIKTAAIMEDHPGAGWPVRAFIIAYMPYANPSIATHIPMADIIFSGKPEKAIIQSFAN